MMSWRFGILIVLLGGLSTGSALADQPTPAAPSGQPQDARLGTCTHFAFFGRGWEDYNAILPMVRQAGFSWVRDDFPWADVEKSKGAYQVPDRYMRWIKAVHQNHLKLILILNYGNDLYADRYDPDAYARFAAAMAKQLKDDVDCFEILNEPANFGYSKAYGGKWNGVESDGSVSPWVGKYVTLCNKAAAAIKAANPQMKVIGLGSVPPVNFRQLAMGISPAVDGLVDHPYSHKSVPEFIPYAGTKSILARDGIAVADEQGSFTSLIANYRAQSKKYKGPKQIWLTEWGYSTFQPTQPVLFNGYTESAQAKYILRRMVQCLGLGIDVSIQYDFKDDGTDIRDAEQHFGLVDAKLQPKPSYEAVKHLTQVSPGLHRDASAQVNVFPAGERVDSIQTYGFRDAQGHEVVAIWSAEHADGDQTDRTADVEVVTDQTIHAVNCLNILTGQRSEVKFKADEGAIMLESLSIPDSPVLLTLE